MNYRARKQLFDPAKVKQAVEKLVETGAVFEFRAVAATLNGDRRPGIVYGYFDNVDALLKELSGIRSAKGFYITINPVDPRLHSRAYNVLKRGGETDTTTDKNIIRRRWLIVDCDVERPTDISSSDVEHEAALNRAAKIRGELSAEGWPEPLYGSSGNGGRLNYRIELPTDDDGLIKRVLLGLNERFGDDAISVDAKVFNPARIDKLPGTLVCKGDDTPERPHRIAALIDVPQVVDVVPVELLATIAAEAPAEGTNASGNTNGKLTKPLFGNAGPDVVERARRYAAKCPPAIQGSDGSKAAYNVARYLVVGFGLSRADALSVMREYNKQCQPEWNEHELEHKVDDAAKLSGERGGKLNESKAEAAETPAKPPKKKRFAEVTPYVPPPVDVLPEPVCGFVKAAAMALGCDIAYILLPLIIALAAAVGTTRRIRLKRTWHEPLVAWGGVVAESGTLKSPALDMATATLERKQEDAFARYADDLEIYKRDLQLHEADLLTWKKNGRKAGEPPPEKPQEPQPARFIIDDITTEAVVDRLQHAPRGLLAKRDELAGWVLGLNQYKGGKGGDAAVWLKMHGARAVTNDRKTGATKLIYVPRAGTWVVGGIQPGILRRILTPEHFESGLSARLLLAMPPVQPKRWTEATVDEATEDALDFIFERLLALDFDVDDDGKAKPVDLALTAEGKAVWIRFYNEHALEQADLTGDLAAAWSKLEGYAARFALLVHLLRWAADDTLENKNKVDDRSVEAGAALARWFGAEARRIYGVMGDDPDAAELRRTVDLIRRKDGTITVRELEKSDRRFRGRTDDAEAELNKLTVAGLGAWEVVPPGPKGGASKRVFRLSAVSAVGGTLENPVENAGCGDADNADKPVDACDVDAVNGMLAEAAEDAGEETWTF